MKNTNRLIALILMCVLLCTVTAACAEEAAPAGEAVQALSLEELAAIILPDFEDLVPWYEEDLLDIMGIEEDDYTDFVYLTDDSGMEGREVIVLYCSSPEAAEKVLASVTAYLARRVKETQNYLPDAWELLDKAVLAQDGATVLMISGPDAAAEAEAFLAAE